MKSDQRADAIDSRLLLAVAPDPRATTVKLAGDIGASRNTVQARLTRWDEDEVLLPFDRRIPPKFLGYPLRAFVLTRVKQRLLDDVSAELVQIPEIVEVLGLSGGVDLLI